MLLAFCNLGDMHKTEGCRITFSIEVEKLRSTSQVVYVEDRRNSRLKKLVVSEKRNMSISIKDDKHLSTARGRKVVWTPEQNTDMVVDSGV